MFLSEITTNEKNLQKQYIQDFFKGEYSSAFSLLSTEQALQNKALLANFLNSISDKLILNENSAKNNIDIYLDNLSIDYNNLINNFINKNNYENNAVYFPFNFVLYNSVVYMYINASPSSGVLPTDTQYWAEVGLIGEKGASGSDLYIKFAWNPNSQYNALDLVTYLDSIWVAKIQNTGEEPVVGSQYWEKILTFSKAKIYSSVSEPSVVFAGQIWMQIEE